MFCVLLSVLFARVAYKIVSTRMRMFSVLLAALLVIFEFVAYNIVSTKMSEIEATWEVQKAEIEALKTQIAAIGTAREAEKAEKELLTDPSFERDRDVRKLLRMVGGYDQFFKYKIMARYYENNPDKAGRSVQLLFQLGHNALNLHDPLQAAEHFGKGLRLMPASRYLQAGLQGCLARSADMQEVSRVTEANYKKLPDDVFHYRFTEVRPFPADTSHGWADLKMEESRLRDQWIRCRQNHNFGTRLETLFRRIAVETGAVEDVYQLSGATTEMLVKTGFVKDLILRDGEDRVINVEMNGQRELRAAEVVKILEDQFESLAATIDEDSRFVLSEEIIKSIHAQMTSTYRYYEVLGEDIGTLPVLIPRWRYKYAPNSPQRADHKVHMFCPPSLVKQAMANLTTIYNREAHGVELVSVRAAWLHHAFIDIHPFADGNGRTARALASVSLIDGGLPPLLVSRDTKKEYIAALDKANFGDFLPIVRYFLKSLRRSEQEVCHDSGQGEL